MPEKSQKRNSWVFWKNVSAYWEAQTFENNHGGQNQNGFEKHQNLKHVILLFVKKIAKESREP